MSNHDKWTDEYQSADGKVTVTLRVESALGDKDTYLTLRCRGGGRHEEMDPTIEGMAVSRNGRRLYVQDCRDGKRRRTTIDLRSHKILVGEPHPSSWDEVILLSDFVPATGDGAFLACSPAFVLTRALEIPAEALSDDQRMAQLATMLEEEPSAEGWSRIMALFQHWPSPAVGKGIAAAKSALARWPRDIRRKPHWLRWYQFHPVWRLVAYGPEEIVIRREPMGNEGAEELASSRLLWRLWKLVLNDCQIGPAGVDALSGSGQIRGLPELSLARNPIGDLGALSVASSPYLEAFKHLDLRRCRIGPEGARALASSPNLRMVKTLRLARNPIGDDGVRALTTSRQLARAEDLDLSQCGIGKAGISALASSALLTRLGKIDLVGNPIGHQGLTQLASTPPPGKGERRLLRRCVVKHDVGGKPSKLVLKLVRRQR